MNKPRIRTQHGYFFLRVDECYGLRMLADERWKNMVERAIQFCEYKNKTAGPPQIPSLRRGVYWPVS